MDRIDPYKSDKPIKKGEKFDDLCDIRHNASTSAERGRLTGFTEQQFGFTYLGTAWSYLKGCVARPVLVDMGFMIGVVDTWHRWTKLTTFENLKLSLSKERWWLNLYCSANPTQSKWAFTSIMWVKNESECVRWPITECDRFFTMQ